MARNNTEISQYQYRFIEAIFKHIERKDLQSKNLGLHDASSLDIGIWFELPSDEIVDMHPNTILIGKNTRTVFRCRVNHTETTVACWLAAFQDAHPDIYTIASKLEEVKRIETLERIKGKLERMAHAIYQVHEASDYKLDFFEAEREYEDGRIGNAPAYFALQSAKKCYAIATASEIEDLIEEMEEHGLI